MKAQETTLLRINCNRNAHNSLPIFRSARAHMARRLSFLWEDQQGHINWLEPMLGQLLQTFCGGLLVLRLLRGWKTVFLDLLMGLIINLSKSMALISISNTLRLVCSTKYSLVANILSSYTHYFSDGSVGYIAMLTQLRNHFQSASKQYIITGAPQCIVPDANMGTMIAAVQFDIIWVQFYNTPYCSARAWVDANPSYTIPGPEAPSRFGFNDWVNFLVGTASANAKLYIGLPGSPSAAGAPSNYLNPTELSNIVAAYFCKPNFGGLMIWEATAAENNPDGPYYSIAKNILTGYVTNSALSCSGSSPSLSPSSGGGGVWVCMTISERSSAPTAPVTSLLTSNVKTSSTLQALSSTAHKPASSGSPAKPTSPPAPAQGSISQDGSCGGANRYVCRSGNCCSQWGFCGVSDKYCGKGCQAAFGICS